MVLCPEVETTFKEICHTIDDAYVRGKSHCIIVVAEGWEPGTQALVEQLRDQKDKLGFSVRVTQLGHVQRGGSPSAFDRLLATRLGAAAARALKEGNAGHMVGWTKSTIKLTPLEEAVSFDKQIGRDLWDLARIMEM